MKTLVGMLLYFLSSLVGILAMDTVYIYNDQGAGKECVKHTWDMVVENLGDAYDVQYINAEGVKEGSWIKNAALFILPGGADIPYCRKLRGTGNARIREYVEAGGAFLGICAGSYYASSGIEFAKGHQRFEVIGKRELALYPGRVIGPVFSEYDYASERGSRAEKLLWQDGEATTHYTIYYKGGGYFADLEKFPEVKTLGYYTGEGQGLPAVVEFLVGKGKVILTAFHIEFDPIKMNSEDEFLAPIIPDLQAGNPQRKLLCREVFQKLGMQVAVAN